MALNSADSTISFAKSSFIDIKIVWLKQGLVLWRKLKSNILLLKQKNLVPNTDELKNTQDTGMVLQFILTSILMVHYPFYLKCKKQLN